MLSAVSRRWDFAARERAALSFYHPMELVRGVDMGEGKGNGGRGVRYLRHGIAFFLRGVVLCRAGGIEDVFR